MSYSNDFGCISSAGLRDNNARNTGSISFFSSKWWDVGVLSKLVASDFIVYHIRNMQVSLHKIILIPLLPPQPLILIYLILHVHLFFKCSGLRSGCFAVANAILVRFWSYGFFDLSFTSLVDIQQLNVFDWVLQVKRLRKAVYRSLLLQVWILSSLCLLELAGAPHMLRSTLFLWHRALI